jgi:hypothetical protein
MDRIDMPHPANQNTITAIDITLPAPDQTRGHSPCHWLGPAMAIWIDRDTPAQRLDRLALTPARPGP